MLTDEQRRQIEMQEADRIRSELIERREAWGGLWTHRTRGLVDDLRSTVIEEPWFGKTATERLNDVSRMVYEPDTLDALGKGPEKIKDAMREFYGYEDPEAEISEPELDHER